MDKLLGAFKAMTVAELKIEVKKRNLKQSGKKADILERLRKYEVESVIHSNEQTQKKTSTKPPEINRENLTENETSGSEDEEQVTIRNAHQSTTKSAQVDSDDSSQSDDRRSSLNVSHRVSSRSRFTIKDVEDSLTNFSGDDLFLIDNWINEFTDMSTLLKWDDMQRFIYAKRMLKGSAKKFVSCEKGIASWAVLKQRLREEFRVEVNSAIIHERLSKRTRKADESSRQYVYAMQEIAAQGTVEDAALIQHIIDGIVDTESNKIMLYEATTIEELKRKLKVYDRVKEKVKLTQISKAKEVTANRSSTTAATSSTLSSTSSSKRKCYLCNEVGHDRLGCPNKGKGIKCYNCDEWGHRSSECPKKNRRKLRRKILRK